MQLIKSEIDIGDQFDPLELFKLVKQESFEYD